MQILVTPTALPTANIYIKGEAITNDGKSQKKRPHITAGVGILYSKVWFKTTIRNIRPRRILRQELRRSDWPVKFMQFGEASRFFTKVQN
ncbi:hypothetical protein BH11PSE12_BH11PSE12_30990 [soil metagenome]